MMLNVTVPSCLLWLNLITVKPTMCCETMLTFCVMQSALRGKYEVHLHVNSVYDMRTLQSIALVMCR